MTYDALPIQDFVNVTDFVRRMTIHSAHELKTSSAGMDWNARVSDCLAQVSTSNVDRNADIVMVS